MLSRRLIPGILACTILAVSTQAATLTVERGSNLQSVINYAVDGDTLLLGIKTFEATPSEFVDSLCGNCLDPKTLVTASTGFVIRGKSLVIIGRDRYQTRLMTKAGYGVYIEDSPSTKLINLTITGGRRDADGNATDAAVVVRRSNVQLENLEIIDNDHRLDSVVVGIGGAFGREGSTMMVANCNIVNNGWDGIALYRGACATVTDCLIKGGRGAGIGVTWDASCVAYRNEVTGYWKGIGAFGTSWVIARNNLVHDNLGWGIIATGQSFMDIANNVVHHNGNCGVAPWSTESRGRMVNNIITENGWREQWVCPCVGVWNYGDWAKWQFSNNIVFNNKEDEYRDIWDQKDINGNLGVDPLFVGPSDFHLQPESPALNMGDSTIYNTDGSRSHIGLHGGPQAGP
ncbi:MAG: right-handed parallel beta-helix repeat-containing protein [candidate division Zixibacteria bacterium]|nr:right-handed parallel beta-helix repeat-containing protein [candidate division Zixibacteria bacterium]MDH3937857.1 right-handed parallel beta-helix repeat-containing protein [candidate division Zixibacteria bacterium]MDH4033423.1 right-handed parallel beta-helix repeat-containing protein [candidate division Zixibacteria bacterium]